MMERVLKDLGLMVGNETNPCVYVGTTNDKTSDGDGAKGKGHIVVVTNYNPQNSSIKHSNGKSFLLKPDMKVSKIDVRNSYRIDNIMYDDISEDIIEQEN
ncbi:hypothetical protein QS460_01200 [Liquorilactobacillus mali]|uniref:Uncharacterized protein n=1 Tax=Liquorilactobacillus mali TaxID=1618 RepID=A0A0R2GAF5_9LACO|nr:hypothetical protein [Liquorilactobacillus mali]KRN34380.1 hypothetical protein IV36_GL000183 [Liquorilactobacillus mali]MDN7144535.1 hypothetical protein [Liquorilactobacillus mali]